MFKDKVEYKGRTYRLRLIDFGTDWGVYFVASSQLMELLRNDESGYTCDEARRVDELIFYYIPTHYFKLSDNDLRQTIFEEL